MGKEFGYPGYDSTDSPGGGYTVSAADRPPPESC